MYKQNILIGSIVVLVSIVMYQEWVYRIEPALQRDVVEYVAPCETLECIIEKRAREIHMEKEGLYFEMSRTEAMDETGRRVVEMMMQ